MTDEEFLATARQIVTSIGAVVEMFFLDHGYGTPAEAQDLATQIVQQLIDEENLIDTSEVGGQ